MSDEVGTATSGKVASRAMSGATGAEDERDLEETAELHSRLPTRESGGAGAAARTTSVARDRTDREYPSLPARARREPQRTKVDGSSEVGVGEDAEARMRNEVERLEAQLAAARKEAKLRDEVERLRKELAAESSGTQSSASALPRRRRPPSPSDDEPRRSDPGVGDTASSSAAAGRSTTRSSRFTSRSQRDVEEVGVSSDDKAKGAFIGTRTVSTVPTRAGRSTATAVEEVSSADGSLPKLMVRDMGQGAAAATRTTDIDASTIDGSGSLSLAASPRNASTARGADSRGVLALAARVDATEESCATLTCGAPQQSVSCARVDARLRLERATTDGDARFCTLPHSQLTCRGRFALAAA